MDLVSIDSQVEHDFVNQLLLEAKVEENIWIDLTRAEGNGGLFLNSDHESPLFPGWADSHPTKELKKKCVQLRSPLKKELSGKWEDVICFRRNYVLCQRYVEWDKLNVQKELIKTERHLDLIYQVFSDIRQKTENFMTGDLDKRLTSIGTLFDAVDKKVQELENKTELITKQVETLEFYTRDLVNNPVPVGFIYAQLPNQPEPGLIWPSVQWTDVSDLYAGLFFRVLGNGTAPFKSVQEPFCPRIKAIATHKKIKGEGKGSMEELKPNGKWSRDFFTGTDGGPNKFYLHVKMAGGEVRPRNTAVVIWKRTK